MAFFSWDDPLATALRQLDIRRNQIRAQMEDREFETKASPERWAKRRSRRAWEKTNGWVIPPGPWSDDLDNYHDVNGYTFEYGDGYIGTLRRSSDATFNGYITLPEGHPMVGLGYHVFSDPVGLDLPYPPQEMTYGMGTTFGYDHCHGYDVKPVSCPRSFSAENYYNPQSPLSGYVDYPRAVKELEEVLEYFKMLAHEHGDAIRAWRAKLSEKTH